MNISGDLSVGSLLGSFDASGRIHRVLSDWAVERGATVLIEDGPFLLWSLPTSMSHCRILRIRCGLAALIGDIFRFDQSSFASWCDVPVAQRGTEVPEGLAGQVSFVLWDSQCRSMTIHADECAAYKVYYHPLPAGGCLFSSDLDLLAATPLVQKRLSRRSLHEYLRFLDISPPNTIYDGVLAIEPGRCLKVDGSRRTVVVEQAVVVAQSEIAATTDEAAKELDRRLVEAVAERLDPKGPTVAFLSGGVDSSLLCSIAGALAPNSVTALTLGFEEAGFDESLIAAKVAAHIGVDHRQIVLPLGSYSALFDTLYSGVEYPFADPAAVATLAAFRESQALGSVALDGTGADTLLGIMPARHYRLAIQYVALLPQKVRRLLSWGATNLSGLRGFVPLVDFDDPEELLIRWRGWTRQEIESLGGEAVSLEHTNFYRLFRSFPRDAHFERYSALMAGLPDDRIHQAARLVGLRVRFPFFDSVVVDYVSRLRPGLRYQDGEQKVLLKKVLARRVPRRIWDAPKHGFDFPFEQLLRHGDSELVKRFLEKERFERWGLFDFASAKPTIDAFLLGDPKPAFKVWSLVVLFAWLELHHERI